MLGSPGHRIFIGGRGLGCHQTPWRAHGALPTSILTRGPQGSSVRQRAGRSHPRLPCRASQRSGPPSSSPPPFSCWGLEAPRSQLPGFILPRAMFLGGADGQGPWPRGRGPATTQALLRGGRDRHLWLDQAARSLGPPRLLDTSMKLLVAGRHSPAVLTLVTCPAQDEDPVWIFGKVSQWPGPEQSLKTWAWPIYQMPPFLRQEVAPRAVVFVFWFFFFFQLFLGSWFGNSAGLRATGSGPSPPGLLGQKTDTAFPEGTLTFNVRGL